MQVDSEAVSEIIERQGYQKASLIGILQDIQARMNYLPRKALAQVSRSLDIPLTDIYEVATFYKAFSLEPKGKHTFRFALERRATFGGAPGFSTILKIGWR